MRRRFARARLATVGARTRTTGEGIGLGVMEGREHTTDWRQATRSVLAVVLLVLAATPARAEFTDDPEIVATPDPGSGAGAPTVVVTPHDGEPGASAAAAAAPDASAPPPVGPPAPSWGSVTLLERQIAPGVKTQAFVPSSESFAGGSVKIPALIVRGATPGPTLCLTAGVHGDELSGIEIVRQIFVDTSPQDLSGMLVGLPVVNIHGFRRSSRYLPDRRDLNRYFPGNPDGSSASRIAAGVFENVVRRCEVLVDFHTGSFHRTNLPQIRADLSTSRIPALAISFGAGVVVQSEGPEGTLRRAATEAGIPALTYEAGEPMRFQIEEIERGVAGVRRLMTALAMLAPPENGHAPVDQHLYYRARWVRVNDGGIFLTHRTLGDQVESGDLLGSVIDPLSNQRTGVYAPFAGHVIGMALSQVVIPGFAAFHIGVDAEAIAGEAPDAAEHVLASDVPPDRTIDEMELTPDQMDPEEHPE
jgi:hypothetical protein